MTTRPGLQTVHRRVKRLAKVALSGGRDLKRQVETLQERIRGDQVQYERVIGTLIRRHYLDAELPPPELRERVGANDRALNFWAKGISSSERVLKVFGDDPPGPVLDWGCGSGRTLVWLRAYPAWSVNYFGCDVDEDAISWLRNRGERQVEVCGDDPPLPYVDGSFTGLFAFSVLTHIPPDKHRSWYEEIRRVLAPGAGALITNHGHFFVGREPDTVRKSYEREGHAFVPGPGHYKDMTFVSEAFTRDAVAGVLEIEEYEPGGYLNQDVVMLRRPDDPSAGTGG